MTNVKFKDALNYLDSTVVFGDGSSCGWNPQGNDTFSQRYIEVKPVSVQKEFCWKDMLKKYMNYEANVQAGRETLSFSEKIIASNISAIQKELEKTVWQGNGSAGIDGYIAQINAEDTVRKESASSIIEGIEKAYNTLNGDALEKGVYIFMSWTLFKEYVTAKNKELNGAIVIDANTTEYVYPYDSRVTIVPVAGLEGTDNIVITSVDNLVYGTDIEGSETAFDFDFDKKESKFYLNVLFNAGVAIKFLDQVAMVTVSKEG
jgi:hypothetical protein